MNSTYDELLKVPLADLIKQADEERRSHHVEMDICTITNAKSGLCSEDCKFCAQSLHHSTKIDAYPLKPIKIMLDEARLAKKNGAERFCIVTSGNVLSDEDFATVAETITQLWDSVGIDADASLGRLSKERLKTLKDAGLTRYHHNIETSRNFYPSIITTHTFDERLATLKAAKEAGLEICSGGIIGLGETWEDRIDMALTLKELDVDSVPINILNPIKGTPLENAERLSPLDAIRTIAIFRIILPGKTIKIAAGRETILKDYQAMCFAAGANGMLIGGYLTMKGRPVEEDQKFIREIEELWENG
ncbi:MAG: biotin synthase BioB [Candidatus Margulisiibacteriota bacterium]